MITGIGPISGSLPALRSLGSGDLAGASSGTSIDGGFGALVSQSVGRTVTTLRSAEELSVQALQGKGDMRTVVDAVMNAEQSLQAAVAIRDKIVSAYLELSRMSI